MQKQINRLMDLAAYFTAKIKQTPGYEMVVDEVCIVDARKISRKIPKYRT